MLPPLYVLFIGYAFVLIIFFKILFILTIKGVELYVFNFKNKSKYKYFENVWLPK